MLTEVAGRTTKVILRSYNDNPECSAIVLWSYSNNTDCPGHLFRARYIPQRFMTGLDFSFAWVNAWLAVRANRKLSRPIVPFEEIWCQ
jgi:hypothetical protein